MLSYLRGYDADFGEAKIEMRNVRWPRFPEVGREGSATFKQLWKKAAAHVDALRADGARVTQTAVLTMQVRWLYSNARDMILRSVSSANGRHLWTVTLGCSSNAHTSQASDERVQDYVANPGKFPRYFQGIVGFGLPRHANATLRLTARCPSWPRGRAEVCRFKVSGLTSC